MALPNFTGTLADFSGSSSAAATDLLGGLGTDLEDERKRRLKLMQDRLGQGYRSLLGSGNVFSSLAATDLFGSAGR